MGEIKNKNAFVLIILFNINNTQNINHADESTLLVRSVKQMQNCKNFPITMLLSSIEIITMKNCWSSFIRNFQILGK